MPFNKQEKTPIIDTLKQCHQKRANPLTFSAYGVHETIISLLKESLKLNKDGALYREALIDFVDQMKSSKEVAKSDLQALSHLSILTGIIDDYIKKHGVIKPAKDIEAAFKLIRTQTEELAVATGWMEYLVNTVQSMEQKIPENIPHTAEAKKESGAHSSEPASKDPIYASLFSPAPESPQKEEQMKFGYAELAFSSPKKPEKAQSDTALLAPKPTEERRSTIASGERPVPKPRSLISLGLEAPKTSLSSDTIEKPVPAPRRNTHTTPSKPQTEVETHDISGPPISRLNKPGQGINT